ncbi:MAG: ATP-grasp domain-containing protein [Proteobacteria bacterium]|nr:ATP-grasp domain-containing protein [Pseudomonadota bacterium]
MKKLKILVFEYITGGDFNSSKLPDSLAQEGLLMLQALVDDITWIESVDPLIMLDYRMIGKLTHNANSHIIKPEHECQQEFVQLMALCDAAWIIAPESDGILQNFSKTVERSGKILLTSSSNAVAVAGDKWLTYRCLQKHCIATVPTQKLLDFSYTSGEWIIKSVDGVGCTDSYVVADELEFTAIIESVDKEKYIIQPHMQGEKTSLSCLFKHGRGWLVCANQQHFELIDQQYYLTGITVNFHSDTTKYQDVVSNIAKAMPDLWGYVGIDLIETANQHLVLEINPRLTTSYAGIYEGLGINCAREVVRLLTGGPLLKPTRNKAVTIKLNE